MHTLRTSCFYLVGLFIKLPLHCPISNIAYRKMCTVSQNVYRIAIRMVSRSDLACTPALENTTTLTACAVNNTRRTCSFLQSS